MCLAWPTVAESTLKRARAKDALLLGRIDGSVAIIDVKDSMNFNRVEIDYCKRDGESVLILYTTSFYTEFHEFENFFKTGEFHLWQGGVSRVL